MKNKKIYIRKEFRNRMKRSGVLLPPEFPLTYKNRFYAKILVPADENGCWEWTANKNHRGYGLVYGRFKMMAAHRLSYELYFGKIAPNLYVCHKCDNPGCVRPDHLFLGTPQDNINDMIEKKRYNKVMGNQHGRRKLNEMQVKEILQMKKQNIKSTIIAEKFNISRDTVTRICRGASWSHIQKD